MIGLCALNMIIQSEDEFLEVVFFSFFDIVFGLYFSGGQNFSLLSSPRFFDLSFELFLGFTLGVALGEDGGSAETVGGLVFDEVLLAVVAQAEPAGSVSTEGSLESEQHDVFGFPVVFVGDQIAKLLLRHVGLALVVHVQQ